MSRAPRRRSLRVHGTVARALALRIVSGELPIGTLLDSEVAAAAQLNVSRTAYREAIRILAAKGLVQVRPRVGTEVAPRSAWNLLDPDVLSWTFGDEPECDVIAKLFELRRMVEPDAARLAAIRRGAVQVEDMREALAGMRRWGLADERGRAADQQFHETLLEASGNAFLISLSSSVGAAVALTTELKNGRLPTPRDPIPDHIAVFDAISDGDGVRAHRSMLELIDLALRDTLAARDCPVTAARG